MVWSLKAGEMAQWLQCLLCRPGDLSSDPLAPMEKSGSDHAQDFVSGMIWEGDMEDCWGLLAAIVVAISVRDPVSRE